MFRLLDKKLIMILHSQIEFLANGFISKGYALDLYEADIQAPLSVCIFFFLGSTLLSRTNFFFFLSLSNKVS